MWTFRVLFDVGKLQSLVELVLFVCVIGTGAQCAPLRDDQLIEDASPYVGAAIVRPPMLGCAGIYIAL